MHAPEPLTPTTSACTTPSRTALLDLCARAATTVVCEIERIALDRHPGVLTVPDAATLAHAIEEAGRTVRRSIALADRLENPRPLRAQPEDPRPARRQSARATIIRRVEDVIESRANGREADDLRAELDERLEDPDLDLDLDTRSVESIADELIRDFGLETVHPGQTGHPRRTPADIRDLRARAARTPVQRVIRRAVEKLAREATARPEQPPAPKIDYTTYDFPELRPQFTRKPRG